MRRCSRAAEQPETLLDVDMQASKDHPPPSCKHGWRMQALLRTHMLCAAARTMSSFVSWWPWRHYHSTSTRLGVPPWRLFACLEKLPSLQAAATGLKGCCLRSCKHGTTAAACAAHRQAAYGVMPLVATAERMSQRQQAAYLSAQEQQEQQQQTRTGPGGQSAHFPHHHSWQACKGASSKAACGRCWCGRQPTVAAWIFL